jgi:transcriptional regulator with XRE-family HTH domain
MPDSDLRLADGGLSRRQELGKFLRATREALDPAEASGGLNRRRRAKGWLREEVASAAGISATWYMWLEQARDVRVSPRALSGLVRALRLDSAKAAYLFRLARPDLNPTQLVRQANRPSVALCGFIEQLSPIPAYVLDVRWDIVAWNAAADLLLGGIDASEKWSYNLLARIFTQPVMRERMQNWEAIAASSVGQFRAATADLGDDPEHRTLLAAMKAGDPLFNELWESRTVEATPNWNKTFSLPGVGAVSFRYQSLTPSGEDEAFRVTIYSPLSAEDRHRFSTALSARGPF